MDGRRIELVVTHQAGAIGWRESGHQALRLGVGASALPALGRGPAAQGVGRGRRLHLGR
jgi:hypothetical protein